MSSKTDRVLTPLADRVWYLPHQELGDQPVLGYVRGDRFSLLIDTGSGPEQQALLMHQLDTLRLPHPSLAILTHWHWDHTFGAAFFPGLLIAGAETQQMLKRMQHWNWEEHAMLQRLRTGEEIPFCDENIRLTYPNRTKIQVRTADILLSGGLSIDLGGVCCEVIPIGGPHSSDSLWIHIPKSDILFAGDADCPDFYGSAGQYDRVKLSNYIAALERCPFSWYVMGHGTPIPKSEILSDLRGACAVL